MKKGLTKIVGLTLGLAMAVGVGVGIASNKQANPVHASTGSYTLTFDSNTSTEGTGSHLASDHSTALTTENVATSGEYSFTSSKTTYYWLCGGCSNVASVSTATNLYPGASQTIKVGKASGDGVFDFTVSGGVNLSINSVVITGKGESGVKLTVAEATEETRQQNVTSELAPYTFTYDSAVKTVSITGGKGLGSSNKPAYISQIVINYTISEQVLTLTGLRIASGEGSVKKNYEGGDNFDPTGLVVQAQWNSEWDTGTNVVNDLVWTPSPLTDGTTSVTGTYTYNLVEQTVVVSGLTVVSPDFVHTYSDNSVYNQTTGSAVEVRTYTPTSGPEYITLGGYNYTDGTAMSFMANQGMYLGNNEEYIVSAAKKYISKIVITTSADVRSKLVMTEGPVVLPTAVVIQPVCTNENKTLTYNFSGENPFFKLTKTGNGYVNVTSIKVYLGGTVTDNILNYLLKSSTINTIHGRENGLDTASVTFGEVQPALANEATPISDPFAIGGVSLQKGGSGNVPKYYTTDSTLRSYSGNTLIFSATNNITRIVVTFLSGYTNNFTADSGSFSLENTVGTWNGAANNVVLTVSATCRMLSISVTYAVSEVSVDNVSMRFGATMHKDYWNAINATWPITDYGVMIAKRSTLDSYSVGDIEDAFDAHQTLANVNKGSGAAPYLDGENYMFTVRVNMTQTENYNVAYVAAPYIVAGGEYYFLQVEYSVKTLAQYYLTNGGSKTMTNACLALLAA